MSERALKQLVGGLAVLVTIWLVMALFRGGSGSIEASGEMGSFFDGIDGTSVQAIRMTRQDGSVTLERSGAGWSANGFPADSGAVFRLLDLLNEVRVGELIAANPNNHDRMGVSSDSAITATFTTADGDRILLVGKNAAQFGTSYVRLPDADQVYLLDGDLRPQLTRDLDSWRDRTMVEIDTAAVTRIVVEREGSAFALVRGDSAWTFDGGRGVVANVVDGVLAEFAGMVATGFLADTDSLATSPLAATVSALSASGEVLAEVTFGAGDGDRWARTSRSPDVYRVSSFRAQRVAPTRDSVASGS
jgi:hypothetical protein